MAQSGSCSTGAYGDRVLPRLTLIPDNLKLVLAIGWDLLTTRTLYVFVSWQQAPPRIKYLKENARKWTKALVLQLRDLHAIPWLYVMITEISTDEIW